MEEELGEDQKLREHLYLQKERSYNIAMLLCCRVAATFPEWFEETHLIGGERKCGQIVFIT